MGPPYSAPKALRPTWLWERRQEGGSPGEEREDHGGSVLATLFMRSAKSTKSGWELGKWIALCSR